MTKTLALEWAADRINVNALCPGPFATEINKPLLDDPAPSEAMLAKVPQARWADPAELGPGQRLEDVFTTYREVLPPGAEREKFKVISHV